MKYIVVGDTHIGCKQSSKTYLNVATTLFDEICEYALDNDIGYFIQVGDLFDNRKALTHAAIECALAIGDKVSTHFTESYFIVGNHDTASKDTMFPHSLMIFKEHEDITIVDRPMHISQSDILLLPWLFTEEDMHPAKICMGHFDINGAMMNASGTVSRNHRLNFKDFDKYQITLSGHYHTPAIYDYGVRYVGSPYQLTFNDMDSARGFYVLDSDTLEMEFIEFHKYPKHFRYSDKSEEIGDIEGHIVSLTFTDDYGMDGNKEIIDRYRQLNPYSLRVKYAKVDEGMTDEEIDEATLVKSKLEILGEYHSKADLPEGINLVILNKISESIYKEMTNA